MPCLRFRRTGLRVWDVRIGRVLAHGLSNGWWLASGGCAPPFSGKQESSSLGRLTGEYLKSWLFFAAHGKSHIANLCPGHRIEHIDHALILGLFFRADGHENLCLAVVSLVF